MSHQERNPAETITEKEQAAGQEERIYSYNRELFYHFDPEKGFTKSVDYQNSSNQVIIKQSWDIANERLEAVKQRVEAGMVSPIAYFMERSLMEIPMLAAYMALPKWRVRMHLKPRVFARLKPALLEKYASVFDISVPQLMKPGSEPVIKR
jgi:hypothetical protein